MVAARTGIAVGKNKGHITAQRDLAARPSERKGVSILPFLHLISPLLTEEVAEFYFFLFIFFSSRVAPSWPAAKEQAQCVRPQARA
jgi:hypothetical protein